MSAQKSRSFRTIAFMAAIMGATLACGTPSEARVTAIVTDSRAPAFGGVAIGSAGPYETLRGRVFGELDPSDPDNTIIQDIQLAPKNARARPPRLTFRCRRMSPDTISPASRMGVALVASPGLPTPRRQADARCLPMRTRFPIRIMRCRMISSPG